MSQRMPTSNPDDQRTDLEAMLAASRELGPDMDKALVDSYMSRQKTQNPPAQRPPNPAGQSILPWGGSGMRYIGFAVLAGSLILVVLLSSLGGAGHSFW